MKLYYDITAKILHLRKQRKFSVSKEKKRKRKYKLCIQTIKKISLFQIFFHEKLCLSNEASRFVTRIECKQMQEQINK